MAILVTGASGRVGRAIFVRLAADCEVRGFDAAPSSTVSALGDVADHAAVARAAEGAQAIIHVAGLHAPHVGLVPEHEFERVNVQGTRNLLEAALRLGIRRFIYTSTTALYGYASVSPAAAVWVTENVAPMPRTIYHRTKLAAELLLEAAAARHGLSVTVLRMSRCFPERAPLMAAYRLHRGVDARDVAEAHALALALDTPGFRVFNISGSTPFLPNDAPALLRDAPAVLRRRAPDFVQAFKARGWPLPASIDRVYCSLTAKRELGWRPRHGFSEVLKMLDERCSEVLPAAGPS